MKKLVSFVMGIGIVVSAMTAPAASALGPSGPTASWTSQPSTGSVNDLTTLSWTLTFSEAVTGLTGGDIENATGFSSTGCVFSVATADASAGLVYTVTVASCTEGTIQPSLQLNTVTDAATNSGPAADVDGSTTVTYDTTVPTALWSLESSGSHIYLASLSWTLTFSEAVTGLTGGDIENATGFSSTGCVFSVATADASAGLVYTVTVASCTDGTIRPSLQLNTVTDAATNSGPAADVDGGTTVTYVQAGPKFRTGATITGVSRVGRTLQANPGIWRERGSFAYQWYSCTNRVSQLDRGAFVLGAVPSGCTVITGATSRTLVLTSAQRGTWVTVKVTGTNGAGSRSMYTRSTPTTIR